MMVVIGLLIIASQISSMVEDPSQLSGGSAQEVGYAFGTIAILILGIGLFIGGIREIRAKTAKDKKLNK